MENSSDDEYLYTTNHGSNVPKIPRASVKISDVVVEMVIDKEVVNRLIPDNIGKDIEKKCQSIYLLHDVFIHKVKVLKKPKFEMDMHDW